MENQQPEEFTEPEEQIPELSPEEIPPEIPEPEEVPPEILESPEIGEIQPESPETDNLELEQEEEEQTEIEMDQPILEDGLTDGAVLEENGKEPEFNEDRLFTLADLSDMEGVGYHVQMEGSQIPVENFELQCTDIKAGEVPCEDLRFLEKVKTLEGGKIKDHAPQYAVNGQDKIHSYVRAHVGNVNVYYMGILHVEDGETSQEYIYYTTDTQITNKTVYAVLKENEKIVLTYSHKADFMVQYHMSEKGSDEENGPDGWGYNEVFGGNRANSVKKGQDLGVAVRIPRGYKATLTITGQNDGVHYEESFGEMLAYKQEGNNIVRKPESPPSMKYETTANVKNILSNIVVSLEYEKVENITFNAYMWTQTAYAKGRIEIHGGAKPSPQNSVQTTDGHSFVWEWDGITSGPGPGGSGNGTPQSHTWELDQLEINEEALIVPMVSLNDAGKEITEKTTLSTGTEVSLTVTSKGGTNAYDGRRHYKLEISNCYEDVTVTGGNMVAHRHQEYAIRELFGVKDAGFYACDETDAQKRDTWHSMYQDTLIGKIVDGKHDNEWTDPLRFKRQVGFYKPDISFTTKEGTLLQKNTTMGLDEDKDGVPYIEYLVRTDKNTDDKFAIGDYEVVSFSDWKESSDGYYYFRGTKEVEEFVGTRYNQDPNWDVSNAYKGVILINIKAHPIRIGLDYLDGSDPKGDAAPKPEDIGNLPETQYGGKNGYNLVDNQKLPISNIQPVDKSNQFVFDHWEMLKTDRQITDELMWGYLTDEVKKDAEGQPYTARSGEEYFIDTKMLEELDHCFYMREDPGTDQTNGNPFNDTPHKGAQTHAILTLRAVWRKYENKPTIPYTVKYITAEVKDGVIDKDSEKIIEERAHTVNKGAALVTDLYQDGSKEPSDSIMAVLQGANKEKTDYTEGGDVRWVIYEDYTTKKIESVDETNNIATIYLLKGNTKINVEKVWADDHFKEGIATVQLQRKKQAENAAWENVPGGKVVLNEKNSWKHCFDEDAYYELSKDIKAWKYQVVELDGEGNPVQDKEHMTVNGNTYQVGYAYDEQKQIWTIRNTRLLDLTISKVVEGASADPSVNFEFDIHIEDEEGNPLAGDYPCTGSVKQGFEDQMQPPESKTISFTDGNAVFSLKHGQQITIHDLPVNAVITVKERNAEGYTPEYSTNMSGAGTDNMILDKNGVVDVKNIKEEVPDTGIEDWYSGAGAVVGVSAAGVLACAALHFLRLRKRLKK